MTLEQGRNLAEAAGKPIIEWLTDNLTGLPELEAVYIVTNDKFSDDFKKWAEQYCERHPTLRIKVINDGSRTDDDKLGAIGDIGLVLTRESHLPNSDLLIVAGDNLYREPLTFIHRAGEGTLLLTVAVI